MVETLTLAVLLTIFLGAFFDAFLFTCLFVFGEAVFILAGGLAYSSGSVLPILAAYCGAYTADQCSYGVGRSFQRRFNRIAFATQRRRRLVRRATDLLTRRGIAAIAVSRFMGPVAWMTPPLAGSLRMPYARFAWGSCVGVVLGVGQFLALGAGGAYIADQGGFNPQAILDEHFWTLFFAGQVVLLIVVVAMRAFSRRLHGRPDE